MNIVDIVRDLAQGLDEAIDTKIISAVAYGTDIYMDLENACDYRMLLIVENYDLPTARKISSFLREKEIGNLNTPIIMEKDEIMGMVDSVPQSFIEILMSFQTVYGEQLITGLSSISQEYLRAQTERSLRENICASRQIFFEWLTDKESYPEHSCTIREIFIKSLYMYHILTKPWLTEEEEHINAFLEEFQDSRGPIEKLLAGDTSSLKGDEAEQVYLSAINQGIVPMMTKVDEMGPS